MPAVGSAAMAAAASASQAANVAAQAVLESAEQMRRSDLLRTLVQKPDVFKPETREAEVELWAEWRHGMRNYLGIIDQNFITELDEIETHPSRRPDLATMQLSTSRRSRELYSILQSFLRHRPAKLVRAVEQHNGYEGWRVLINEMQPSSRQRQMALASQLANVKFDAKLSLAEQLTKYEEVIREYERVSGSRYNEDLKISTLVQACPGPLQVQIHMSLTSESTYQDLKDKVLAYERSTARLPPLAYHCRVPAQRPQTLLSPWRSTRYPRVMANMAVEGVIVGIRAARAKASLAKRTRESGKGKPLWKQQAPASSPSSSPKKQVYDGALC